MEDTSHFRCSCHAPWARALAFGVVMALVGWQVRVAESIVGLSKLGIAYSEADTIRAAESYAVEGFTRFAGLPVFAYGDQFPESGTLAQVSKRTKVPDLMLHDPAGEPVTDLNRNHRPYTHYPPGPYLAAGVARSLFGKGHIARYRLLPIAFGLVCLLLAAELLCGALGPVRGLIVLLGSAAAPMCSNTMHGLIYQSYAMSLLVLELALIVMVLKRPPSSNRAGWWALGFVGFVHGWISFDYAFVVIFAPLVVAPVMANVALTSVWPRAVGCTFALGAGFTLAHGAHFVQVAAHFGSVSAAVSDMLTIAGVRGGMDLIYEDGPLPVTRVELVLRYLKALGRPEFLGYAWHVVLGVAVALTVFRRGRVSIESPRQFESQWRFDSKGVLMGFGIALAVCAAWVVTMPNHAWYHISFLPRSFFLLYFVLVLGVTTCFTIHHTTSEREEAPGR